jgi:hypothetical protein
MSALHDVLRNIGDTKPDLSRHLFPPPLRLMVILPSPIVLAGACGQWAIFPVRVAGTCPGPTKLSEATESPVDDIPIVITGREKRDPSVNLV